MRILTTNFIAALRIAIETQSKREREEWGYTGDSILVAGWKQILEAAERGEQIEVREQ